MATVRKDNPESDDPDYTLDLDDGGLKTCWLTVGENLLRIASDSVEVYEADDEISVASARPYQRIMLFGESS